jgi:hypothetical protein
MGRRAGVRRDSGRHGALADHVAAVAPPDMRTKFPTVISDVATTGNSGSGVFDAGQKCLLGIMSRKIFMRADAESEPKDIAKYFVPASTIGEFIPSRVSLLGKLPRLSGTRSRGDPKRRAIGAAGIKCPRARGHQVRAHPHHGRGHQ